MQLREYAKGLADSLQALGEGEDIVLSPELFPRIEESLSAHDLSAHVGPHVYEGSLAVNVITVFGAKLSLQRLGLLTLAALFGRTAHAVTLELNRDAFPDAAGVLETLVLHTPAATKPPEAHELVVEPRAYRYRPSTTHKHPWHPGDLPTDPCDLPIVGLTDRNGFTPSCPEEASSIHGFGGLMGSLRMAILLVDLARPEQRTYEVDLECDAGYRGVGPASNELRFRLPGSLEWSVLRPNSAEEASE